MADPMTLSFYVAMQAAGAIGSFLDTQSRIQMLQLGKSVDDAMYNANMATIEANAAKGSQASMDALRENLGTQLVVQAARGTGGGGTAGALANKSVKSTQEDLAQGRLNLMAQKANLKTQHIKSGLEVLASETQLGQQFRKEVFDMAAADIALFGLRNK